jgi:cysteinyl-tRNA synthetase
MRQQILAIGKLMKTGHAYETDLGIYFSVATFPDYGKLSGNFSAEQLAESVRDVVSDTDKRDPRDFALWKKDEKHLMQWYSPWGWGFPGWHIECSVMSTEYLGEQIDIHAGGEDLIFPHHECEIAQSESLSGKQFARYWVHTRFLQVDGMKMSKRDGNFYTVQNLIADKDAGGRGFDPSAVRLALISGQYRKPYNFTFDTLKASTRHVQRIREARSISEAATGGGAGAIGDILDATLSRALAAMLDDLNTPEAIAAGLEGVKAILGAGTGMSRASADAAIHWLDKMDELLGWESSREALVDTDDALAAQVDRLLDERTRARSKRDFERADAIRAELTALGVEVMDSPDGPKWRRKLVHE